MEDFQAFIFVAGSVAIAFAFGWTATCKLIALMAGVARTYNKTGRLAVWSPAQSGADQAAGFDEDVAVVIDLRAWKSAAALRGRFRNGMPPAGDAASKRPRHATVRLLRSAVPHGSPRASSVGPNKTRR
jgi:hypothetical protein